MSESSYIESYVKSTDGEVLVGALGPGGSDGYVKPEPPLDDWEAMLQEADRLLAEVAGREALEANPPTPVKIGAIRPAPADPGVTWDGELGLVRPDLVDLDVARRRIAAEIRTALEDNDGAPRVKVIVASTGAGKTEAAIAEICRAVAEGRQILYLVPTLAEQARIWAALRQRGINAHQWYARSGDEDSPGFCQRHTEIAILGQRNRWTAPLACASCPFGLAAMATIHATAGRGDVAEKIRTRIEDECHVDPDTITPCQWILTKDLARSSDVIVATHAAYTPALASERQILVDEEPELGNWLSVAPDDAHDWIDGLPAIESGLRKLASRLEKSAAIAERRGGALERMEATRLHSEAHEAREQADRLYDEVESMLIRLRAGTLTEMINPTRRRLPAELGEILTALAGWAKPIQDQAGIWERATMTWGATPVVPLRAIMALAAAVEREAVWIDAHGIHAAVPSTLGAEIIEGDQPVAVLCATPTRLLRDVADELVEIPVDQGVEMTLFPRHTWGKSGLRTDPHTLASFRRWTRRWSAKMADGVGADPWVATHAAVENDDDLDDPVSLHYGNHRGRNDLAGRPGLILGPHRLAPVVEATRWDLHRAFAVAGGADQASWPEQWNPERGPVGEMVEVAPNLWVASPMRLPVDPQQRAWLLDDLAIHTVQVVGRARGAQHVADGGAPIPIWNAGVPLPLGRYGIRVVAVEDDPEGIRRTPGDYRSGLAADADRRAQVGMAGCRSEGTTPSRRNINLWLSEHNLPRLGGRTYSRLLEAGLLGEATTPEVLAEMESLVALGEGDLVEIGQSAEFMVRYDAEVSKIHPATLAAAMILATVAGTWAPPEPEWARKLDPHTE